jgi:FAD synthetase
MGQNILIWGTFDVLHPGHVRFLRACAKLGNITAVVVPDKVVKKNKGHEPRFVQTIRAARLVRSHLVDRAVVDCFDWGLKTIDLSEIGIICLGHDQNTAWERRVIALLRQRNPLLSVIQMGAFARGRHQADWEKVGFAFWLITSLNEIWGRFLAIDR